MKFETEFGLSPIDINGRGRGLIMDDGGKDLKGGKLVFSYFSNLTQLLT